MPSRLPNKRFQQTRSKPFEYRDKRTTDNKKFYQSSAWSQVRLQQLMREPLCRLCQSIGFDTPATTIDHITPIEDGGSKTDSSNLQSLCSSCHNRKSGREAHKRDTQK